VPVYDVLNRAEIYRIGHSPTGGVARDLLRRGRRWERAAKRQVGVDSGRLRADIHTELVRVAGELAVQVGSGVRYARWHHDGTGLYGPRHRRIYPKRAKVLVFRVKGGRLVFARSVAGSRPNRYLHDTRWAARD
jgi:hypothetical protein